MFDEAFEKLGMMEQEQFRRIVNWLLAHTFLIQGQYDFENHIRRTNPDYLFVERHFELFQDYLQYSGFRLERDSNYGIISLTSDYDANRQKLDKISTLMIYVLRLIYEEEREKLSLSREIFVSVGELIHKMISLGVVKKKPSDLAMREGLRKLSRFQIIEKMSGKWEAADTKLLILPTILFIVTNERISNMYALMEEEFSEEEDWETGTSALEAYEGEEAEEHGLEG